MSEIESGLKSETESTTESKIESTATKPAKVSDRERLINAVKYHGLALLGAITLWGAADAWVQTSDLYLATIISVLNAFAAGSIISILFHEWGHFAGARFAGSYSPMVNKPTGTFIFGFNFAKNNRDQFISMSLGGPIGNWLLVLLVFTLIPMDSPGRVMLLAVTLANAISVCVFELPILMKAMDGGDPETELNAGLANGSGDKGKVWGYGIGALVWLLVI